MSDDAAETIDPRVFIKQLAPDQLGLYEPLSGLMLLNVSRADFVELGERWAAQQSTPFDVEVIRTINHETYHFAQAAASGYVFHRLARLFTVLNESEPAPEAAPDPEEQALIEAMRKEAAGDPELEARLERTLAMLEGHRRFAELEARAAPGDHSITGALLPAFFAHLEALGESERAVNSDGLSILGVLEGSAVAHTHMLMHPDEDAAPYIEAELATLPPVYRELYDLTIARAGERALALMLPAVALALRYARPNEAYAPLLAALGESAPGDALEHGRALADALPEIADAGPIFGTAIDLRQQDDRYRLYDAVLEHLGARAWGIDSYDFLAQPAAMHAVGSFPLGIVTSDGYLGALDKLELAARMGLMGAVLRTQSRRRAEREFRKFQVDWARSVIARLIGDDAPPAAP